MPFEDSEQYLHQLMNEADNIQFILYNNINPSMEMHYKALLIELDHVIFNLSERLQKNE